MFLYFFLISPQFTNSILVEWQFSFIKRFINLFIENFDFLILNDIIFVIFFTMFLIDFCFICTYWFSPILGIFFSGVVARYCIKIYSFCVLQEGTLYNIIFSLQKILPLETKKEIFQNFINSTFKDATFRHPISFEVDILPFVAKLQTTNDVSLQISKILTDFTVIDQIAVVPVYSNLNNYSF